MYPTPKRSGFPSYRSWLSTYEYEALKNVNADLMARHGVTGKRLLDMACWDGKATRHYGDRLGIPELFGVDCVDARLVEAKARGVEARLCDFERDAFPFEDSSFDVVVANQIFEHLKQIYRPMSEIHRTLKPGGYLLFSVPNLGGLYYRMQALLGRQPSTISVFEAHVRAFSVPGAREFVTLNGLFEVVAMRGSGFYPFPPPFSEWLSGKLTTLGVFQTWLLRKRDVAAPNWQDHVAALGLQSNF